MLFFCRLALFALHICCVSEVRAAASRIQSNWPNVWPSIDSSGSTLESLNLTPEDVITTSPEADADAAASAFANPVSSAPRPFNVVILSDSPSELKKLRSDVDNILSFTRERQIEALKQFGMHQDPAAKIPMKSPPPSPPASFGTGYMHYQLYTSFIAIFLVYIVAVPLACKLLYGGRKLARQHIPLSNGFYIFFIAFNVLQPLFGVGFIHSLLCLGAAYSGYRAAMRPLRIMRLFPRDIRKEPIGWIFEILCVCALFANVIYRLMASLFYMLFGNIHVAQIYHNWISMIYVLFILSASGAILLALMKIVPTFFAQELVFACSSLYVLLSAISFLNDLCVYCGILGITLVAVDPTVFFCPMPLDHANSGVYMISLCIGSAYTAASFSGSYGTTVAR
uniref:Transmembrane protein n=1 Tax=Babesia bovis TaxID=5865 RepID=S6BIG0_BABBO|nr:hypothetical protein, conserved in Plasmodium species [Babesia bovis]